MPASSQPVTPPDSQFERAVERVRLECDADPEAAVARFGSAL